MSQTELFPNGAPLPEGLVYEPALISRDEERELIAAVEALAFADIRMHGVVAKRRAAHFGRGYEYNSARLKSAPPIPEFLLPLRARAAALAGRNAGEIAEVLVTDYLAGAGIGWPRDAPPFEIIAGISLLSACMMQFRPWPVQPAKMGASKRPKPLALVLEPRSAYILRGPSRTAWEHHIPMAKSRRYSITFRTLRAPKDTEAYVKGCDG